MTTTRPVAAFFVARMGRNGTIPQTLRDLHGLAAGDYLEFSVAKPRWRRA